MINLSNMYKNVLTRDGTTSILKDINLKIKNNDLVCLVGESGSGKTTLLNIIGTLQLPTSGIYLFENQNISDFSMKKLAQFRNKNIGFIFQSFNLIDNMSVIENIKIALIYSCIEKKLWNNLIKYHLNKIGIFKLRNRNVNELSGGQLQRVAIARALITNANIILADEPTGNLDKKNSFLVQDELFKLHDEGKTLIEVTHNANIASLFNKQILIEDGMIVNKDYKK